MNALAFGTAAVSLNTGGLRLSHPLDFDLAPGASAGGSPALAYNSATVAPRPSIDVTFGHGPGAPAPQAIEARLTWDGRPPQGWVAVPFDPLEPGADHSARLTVAAPVRTSGVYGWTVTVRETFADGMVVQGDFKGSTRGVVRDDAASPKAVPISPGWSIAGIDRIILVAGGALLYVDGRGDSRLYAETDAGTLYGGPGDFGVLEGQWGHGFTYTTKDKVVRSFDAAGYLTSVADRDGVALTYVYGAGRRLAAVHGRDGGSTALAYDGGRLATVTEPGGRVVTLSYGAGGNLAGVEEAGGGPRAFAYDASPYHLLKEDAWSPLVSAFSYAPTGEVDSVELGGRETNQVRPAGSPLLPSGQARATVRDGLGRVTTYTLDRGGRTVRAERPLGIVEAWDRDVHGQVTRHTDPLQYSTDYEYDYGAGFRDADEDEGDYEYVPDYGVGVAGDLVLVSEPGVGTRQFRYDPEYHDLVASFNEAREYAAFAYDERGHLSKAVDPEGNVVTYLDQRQLEFPASDN